MAAIPQRTLTWLWDVLRREYHDVQRAYSDLAQTLVQYPSLAPRTDVYTSESGVPALLLHLNGTLSVSFRGNQYGFPVAVWIPHAYPREPPIFYVTPTDDMVIRPGQHVSGSDGKIYHPYLARWREAWERSTIVDFLRLLIDVFAREPPVASRQQGVSQQQIPLQNNQTPPRPPLPTGEKPLSARPMSDIPDVAPPPPPKPGARLGGTPQSTVPPEISRPKRYDAPPPLPNQAPGSRLQSTVSAPPNQYQVQFHPQGLDGPKQYLSDQRVSAQVSSQTVPQANQYPIQRQSVTGPSISIGHQQHHTQQQSNHQGPPQNQPLRSNQTPYQQHQYQQQQPHPGHPPPQQQQTYQPHTQPIPQLPKPKTPQPNLMDESPFDISLPATNANLPTPAIPPNPEKQHILQTLSSTLLTTLQNQITQSTSALAPLQSQHIALQAAEQKLQSELVQLKTLQGQISQNITSLDSTIKAADRTILSSQSSSSPDKVPSVDELIIPPTVVARQLYDAVAEQRGYEATIYALTEGFVRGRIGSELWARKTREVAREDFRRKYLIKKRLGVGMGLDMGQMP